MRLKRNFGQFSRGRLDVSILIFMVSNIMFVNTKITAHHPQSHIIQATFYYFTDGQDCQEKIRVWDENYTSLG